MDNFAAIDFETANYERTSVCSVGVVVVRNGVVAETFYSLIQPEPNYYAAGHGRSPRLSGGMGPGGAVD